MSALRKGIVAQFRKPSGPFGVLAGAAMAARPSNRLRNEWTLDLLDIQETDHFFELGCGPGYALYLASRRAGRGFVTGVDHSPVMAAMARRRLARPLRDGRANIILGGPECLRPFAESLDKISSANVVQFLPEPQCYFDNAFAALRSGGIMATTYQPRGAAPDAAQARAMAERCTAAAARAGFAAIETHLLELRGAPAICVLAIK